MLQNSNNDVLHPTEEELKSRELAELICYVVDTGALEGWYDPATIERYRCAAKDSHGCVAYIDGMTAFLKKLPGHLGEERRNAIIYNGRNKMARRLADWLEENMEPGSLYQLEEVDEDEDMKKLKPFLDLDESSATIIRKFLTTFLEVMDKKVFLSYRAGMEAVIKLCKNKGIRRGQ